MHKKSILLTLSTLLLLFAITPQVNSQFSLNITVQTDKPSYTQRQLVTVKGNVTFEGELVQDGLVGVQIENPLTTIIMRTLPLSTNSSEQYPIQILSLFPCNDHGKFKPDVERNKYMWCSVTVKNNGITSRQVYLSITILDSARIPLDTDQASFSILPGKTVTFIPRMNVPNWATVGKAFIYASTYSSWPKDGGIPLCPEKTSYFNIIESIYSDDPSGTPSEDQPVQNGTYEIKFRLPPDMIPGTYQISVTAWYKGYAGSSSTSFNGNYIPSPPWPSFVIKPPKAAPNYTITFDASSSSPEGYNDSITGYFWTFGDLTNATGKVVTHSYTNIENYTVTLNVTDSEGFWNITSKIVEINEIHDISLQNIHCPDTVYDTWMVYVTVTMKNKGTVPETFDIRLYSNDSLVDTKQVTVNILEKVNVTLTWNTTGITVLSNYYLKVETDVLPNEINATDNTLNFGPVWTLLLGDVDGNRIIDIFDVTTVAIVYGQVEGETGWYLMADLLRDGIIDIYDVVVASIQYGTEY